MRHEELQGKEVCWGKRPLLIKRLSKRAVNHVTLLVYIAGFLSMALLVETVYYDINLKSYPSMTVQFIGYLC